jgi:hypothetical protein
MPVLAPPPSTDQDINSRQYRDWFYSIYALIGTPGSTLGTMAYQNYDAVGITGGQISNVGLSSVRANGLTGYLYGNGSASPITASTTIPYGNITGTPTLGTIASQNANAVAITGGTISGVAITGSTIPYSNVTGTPTGVSATITTAKLTPAGANGSMTFTNGILTAQTQAT